MTIPLALLASLLFSMIGPIALLPLFSQATAGASRDLQRKIAIFAGLIAFASLAIAIFVGASVMASAGTSKSSLIIAAGIILLITALLNIFGAQKSIGEKPGEPSLALALIPIAIPGIVTPVGVAIVILFASYFPAVTDRLAMLAIIAALMGVNVLAMLSSNWFMRVIGPAPLIILGAIFGVLQAAMGVEMIFSGVTLSKLFAPH